MIFGEGERGGGGARDRVCLGSLGIARLHAQESFVSILCTSTSPSQLVRRILILLDRGKDEIIR